MTAPPPPPPHGSAYAGHPFGPFADHHNPTDRITRSQSPIIDLTNASGWTPVSRVDTADFSWGVLIITGEAKSTGGVPIGTGPMIAVEAWPWIEVRVLVTSSGVTWLWFEGAVGSHDSETADFYGREDATPGPIVLPFALGDVPDLIEVYARPMLGGLASGAGATGADILSVAASTRFRV